MQLDSGAPAGSPRLSPLLPHVLATLSPPPWASSTLDQGRWVGRPMELERERGEKLDK